MNGYTGVNWSTTTKSMKQYTFLTQKDRVHHNPSTGKQKTFRNYHTSTTHNSEFQLPLQNRFESIYLSDLIYPAEETSGKFGINSERKILVMSPVHKVGTECRKVPSDKLRYWQSVDNSVKISQNDNPNKEQGKCKKTHKICSKIIWPQDKYKLTLQVKKEKQRQTPTGKLGSNI